MKCKFCEIIQHKSPAAIVFENEDVIAFLDIKPLFAGHTLLIPKVHYETIWDIPETLLATLMSATKILSIAVRKALTAEGIFIANNNIISQSVPHFHMHVVPRNKKDGLKGFFWPRQIYADDLHKGDIKDKIIAQVNVLI